MFLTNRSILRRRNRPLLCLRAATSGRSENNAFTLYTIHSQLAICLLYCHLFYKYIIQDSVLSNESRRFPAWKPTFGCGKKNSPLIQEKNIFQRNKKVKSIEADCASYNNYFSFICFSIIICFLFNVLFNVYFLPSTFSVSSEIVPVGIPSSAWDTQPPSVYFPGHKTSRELVEEREQRTKENETKKTHIKEKVEELKKLHEKFLMAISTAIDKWVEHANDEGWLTSFV